MKVVGFTFIRNAIQYAFPIQEAIESILPICDEVVVAVGKSEDKTLEFIQSLTSPKIRIIETVWDDSLREGGHVLAQETNKAFDAISEDADWCVYIQGDEVLHEDGHEKLRAMMKQYLDDDRVEGFLVAYLHFWATYDYIGDSRRWYRKEIRVIRNNKKIRSYRDAQGFRKDDKKLLVKDTGAKMCHYGWVRPPEKLQRKRLHSHRFWHSDEWILENIPQGDEYDYNRIDSVRKFEGKHPKVMQKRIDALHWDFVPPQPKLSLKNRFTQMVERLTGWRMGEYKNYRILK